MVVYNVNFVAVLVSAVAAMAIGMLWYGPLFGKKWMKLSGISEKQAKKGMEKGMAGMAPQMVAQLVASAVMAFVLSMFMSLVGATGVMGGLTVAFWAWLGFVATVSLSSVLWEGKSVELYALNNGSMLVTLLVQGAILAAMA